MNSFIGTKEAARRLGISMRRVQALIAAGRLPAEKVGNSFVIKEKDLASVNERKNGHPRRSADEDSLGRRAHLLESMLGRFSFGPDNVATNTENLEGFGSE